MALEMAQIAAQIPEMVARLQEGQAAKEEQCQRAIQLLGEVGWEALRDRIEARRRDVPFFLPAGLVEGISQAYPVPPCPEDYTVLAVDGSQIDVDRHAPVGCYLINVGWAVIRYGADPAAELESRGEVYLSGLPLDTGSDDEALAGHDMAIVNLHRATEEMKTLSELVGQWGVKGFSLALFDGPLILWEASLQDRRRASTRYLEDYVSRLDRIREKAVGKGLAASAGFGVRPRPEARPEGSAERSGQALAGYTSFTASREVVNALRMYYCWEDAARCRKECSHMRQGSRICDQFDLLNDRDLFRQALGPGERSTVFASKPRIMGSYRGEENQIYFFYLRVEEEIARVEVPGWVATNPSLLEFTHAAILDQCRRGYGYPASLMEAHERAVVTERDRENFWQLVSQALAQGALPEATSAKSKSKRTRWL